MIPYSQLIALFMETIAAIIFLLLPGAVFWVKNNADYGSSSSFGVVGKSLIILLAFYIFTIILLGAEQVQGANSLLNNINLKKFGAFFIFPGVGIAIILFPKIAAEYSENYLRQASANALEIFSVVGWVILFISALSALVWYY